MDNTSGLTGWQHYVGFAEAASTFLDANTERPERYAVKQTSAAKVILPKGLSKPEATNLNIPDTKPKDPGAQALSPLFSLTKS